MKPDRSQMQVRKFKLGDPEQEFDPEIAKLSPSQRLAIVCELSQRLAQIAGIKHAHGKQSRHVVRVIRGGR